MPTLFIDADACPVKAESIKVATRHDLDIFVVSNSGMRTDPALKVKNIVVGQGFDAADDWIVEHLQKNDIVVTADIQLAARCLKLDAFALGPTGKIFSLDNIGPALAMRELHSYLREMGEISGHNASFSKNDRSQFLQALDLMILTATKTSERKG